MSIPDTSTTHLMIFSKEFKRDLKEVASLESDKRGEYVSLCQLTREALELYVEKLKYEKR